jgi:hypothetical protein
VYLHLKHKNLVPTSCWNLNKGLVFAPSEFGLCKLHHDVTQLKSTNCKISQQSNINSKESACMWVVKRPMVEAISPHKHIPNKALLLSDHESLIQPNSWLLITPCSKTNSLTECLCSENWISLYFSRFFIFPFHVL